MTCICERNSAQDESGAGRTLDEMLGDITVRRVALERSLALAAATLYPELWHEITFLRRQAEEHTTQIAWLIEENERLRAAAEDTAPTVPLHPVPETPAPADTAATDRARRPRRPRAVPLLPGRRL